MDDLGLSSLSDDQFLGLIQAVMSETLRRGTPIAMAVNREVDRTAQDLRDIAHRAQTANANITSIAGKKAAVITALIESHLFRSAGYAWDAFALNFWEKGDLAKPTLRDRRLYIQQSFVTDGWKITYFHDGNNWNDSGAIVGTRSKNLDSLIPFCRFLCESESPGFKCYSSDIKKADPDTTLLQIYQQLL
jgi:hypothetical protein